jgi:two-component system NtrC family response regulator
MRRQDAGRVAPLPSWTGHPPYGLAILVIARSSRIARLLAEGFGEARALVELAPSLEAAEQLRRRLRFDVIVSEQEGVESAATEWVAERRRGGDHTPVVLVVASADRDAVLRALRAGASDLLTGAPTFQDLAERIERLLGSSPVARDATPAQLPGGDDVFDRDGIVGESQAMTDLSEVIRRIAPVPTTVLVEGASGTGKELVARAIHRLSGRKGPFAAINCGAITADLFESELFGHIKGAFTGALQARDGLFAYAEGGTIFLDEIGEMPLSMQAKLLRVLEQRTIRPVGGNRELPVDVRVIAATNHDLRARVDAGAFREDLFHRINVLVIRVPALRERPEDIPVLGRYFLQGISARMGIHLPEIGDGEWLRLRQYPWPGNVRELRNLVERCALLNQRPSACLGAAAEGDAGVEPAADDLTLDTFERQHIRAVVELSGGNKSQAARRLGISRKTLERKLRRWESAAASDARPSRRAGAAF